MFLAAGSGCRETMRLKFFKTCWVTAVHPGESFDFVYGFKTAGLSAGLYTSDGMSFSTSRFLGLDDTPGTFTRVLFRANILGNVTAVPEPATSGLMIAGFGMIGGAMRRRVAQTA